MRSQAPTMTRAHFQYLADWVKFDLPYAPGIAANDLGPNDLEIIARSLADALAGTNGQFNRDRFLKACGVAE